MTIHHVGRSYHVGAGLRTGHGGLCQQRQCLIVQDLAVFDQTAVSVGGVLAQTDVRDDHQLRKYLLDVADGLLNDSVFIVSLGTALILVGRDAEHQHTLDACLPDPVQFLIQTVDGILVDARHGLDRVLDIFSFYHKNRIDQI